MNPLSLITHGMESNVMGQVIVYPLIAEIDV
jgi:hypothetical protein